jgi:PTS system fructose-specific IIA component/PTS system nitrogen regulatory IIA component
MTNFLIRDALVPSLTATTKEGVIRELVKALQTTGYFKPDQVETVVGEVLRREGLGSTGIGRAVAIPHSRFEGLPKLIGTLGISRTGIPFASIDHRDVHLVFLLLSRPDDPAPHLQALDMIVRVTERDEFIADMMKCQTREEMWDLLEKTPLPWDDETA